MAFQPQCHFPGDPTARTILAIQRSIAIPTAVPDGSTRRTVATGRGSTSLFGSGWHFREEKSMAIDRDAADWFEQLTGFRETSWHDTRARLVLDGRHLVSQVDGRRLDIGDFEMASLQTLRQRARQSLAWGTGRLRLSVVRGDVRDLHTDPDNAGALFQVASQFNMLEMVSPHVSPEDGITRYALDRTQGPACAMAAGGATLYRNHFVEIDGKTGHGQTRERQLDGLRDVGAVLSLAVGVPVESLWSLRNGYALCSAEGLQQINALLTRAGPEALDHLRALLRVGVHRQADVTWGKRWTTGQPAPTMHSVTT
jgi:hypothetical protein